MLAPLLEYCVEQIALDGEAGTDMARLFAMVDAHITERTGMPPKMDDTYKAYLWKAMLAHPAVRLGTVHAPHAEAKHAARVSVHGKSKSTGIVAPTPLDKHGAQLGPLHTRYGEALRLYLDADVVRRVVTGTDLRTFLSDAAYTVLQLVCRARENGMTVVALGAATAYDQKTVFYLVKTLVERDLVAKFSAPEMGHVSNYVVDKRYLAQNPQWSAQQAAQTAIGEPVWVTTERLALLESGAQHDEKDTGDRAPDARADGLEDVEDAAAAPRLPPALYEHEDEMLAYPLLSEEQSNVWLHSRQDLLTQRLHRLLERSPQHTTPRAWLALRLGLRPCRGLKRAFITYLNRFVHAGLLERVQVQLGNLSPLYVRATPQGLAQRLVLHTDAPPAAETLPRWALQRERTIEWQLHRAVGDAGIGGCTMQNLAAHFGASHEIKRMMEQILGRQAAAPYSPWTLCAPFEQQGRERRIRYYTFCHFCEKCAKDEIDVGVALGYANEAALALASAPVPTSLPGEAHFTSAEAYQSAVHGAQMHTLGFFRDVSGPVPLSQKRKANIDPLTGQAKRGRPRKVAQEPAVEAVCAPHDAAPHDAAPQQDTRTAVPPIPPAPRKNLTLFHRSAALQSIVHRHGGAIDTLDIARLCKESSTHLDFSDRTTRAKVVAFATQHGLLNTTRTQRHADEAHRQRTILYDPDITPSALQTFVQAVAAGDAGWDGSARRMKRAAITADDAGLAAPSMPTTLPWATAEKVAPDADPMDDLGTQRAFARLSHVLRQYYGFPFGRAARLRLFHEAAFGAARHHTVPLAWFWTKATLWTYIALIPVRLQTQAVLRAVTNPTMLNTPLEALPEMLAQRLGVGRQKTYTPRFQRYAAQLCTLGLAEMAPDATLQLATAATLEGQSYALHTLDEARAFWSALRAAHAPLPLPMLHSTHAWQDMFQLKRQQKAFLRRYRTETPCTPALLARLAATIFAPYDAVEAFFAHAPKSKPLAAILAQKVADRRAARESTWDAALAEERAQEALPSARRETLERLLAHQKTRYLGGKTSCTVDELRAQIRSTIAAQRRHTKPRMVRRREHNAIAWSAQHQDTLRDAYVILHHRHLHGAPLDWTALLQCIRADPAYAEHASAAWNTWRARLKQLASAPDEQVYLLLLERAWGAVLKDAHVRGALDASTFPSMTELDLVREIAYLRAHVQKETLMAEHAAEAKRTMLPYVVSPAYAARWQPMLKRASLALPNETLPMVHRLHMQRAHAFSTSMYAFAHDRDKRAVGARAGVYDAAVKMLAETGNAAWRTCLDEDLLEAGLARMLAQKMVRFVERGERRALAFTDEFLRLLHAPLSQTQAAAAAAVHALPLHAHPAASEGETAAWIQLLADGAVRPTLDTAPLGALRQRSQLNARTLDDVETECSVALARTKALPAPVACNAPCVWPTGRLAHGLLRSALERAGPDGLPVAQLAPSMHDAARNALEAHEVLVTGYDTSRLVLAEHAEAWAVPLLEHGHTFPRTWRDVHGNVNEHVWRQRLALVLAWVTARPGLSFAHLLVQLGGSVDRAELWELMCASAETGRITVRPYGGDYRLCSDAEIALDVGDGAYWFQDAESV
ncbi:oxalate--CoA ligase [Malassezia vespertilionis]|uniref:Uncharacterized protein n=1 Tax=Malassezia vespertilionis TaxID=2020962 RepID=A0A2N1J9G0_9BASI|nr:oxalate--CoA ligase [Malassezia vespertilionis]PKI83195.1 hypothetical protein MVES_003072 [Malassezia vespertilionis]WFD07864.1 oxalate--CoA ligase [Malassezia vespertilionis]